MWIWPIIALITGIVVTSLVQFRASRKSYRPLASRQPTRADTKVPLGLEGLDLEKISQTNRRNESLERGQTNWLSKAGFFGRTDNNIAPIADDETYAARYHAAFQKDPSKDQ